MAGSEVKVVTNKQAEAWLKGLIESNMSVHVGIVGDPATSGADSAESAKKTRDGTSRTSLFEVAATHEFGSPKRNIPQRSFLRSTYDEQRDNAYAVFIKALKKQGEEYGASQAEQKKVFSLVGEWLANKIKAKFTRNSWAPLKDPTRGGRNRLGRGRPLIDTGQLRASISYQVVEGDAK